MATAMSRCGFLAALLALACMVQSASAQAGAGGAAAAAAPARADTDKPRPARAQAVEPLILPGFPALNRKLVRDEIGLSAEQTAKLVDINKKYMLGIGEVLPEAAGKKLTPEEVRKQVAGVLTQEQLTKLETVELRLALSRLVADGLTGAKLALNEEQKDKLAKSRADLQKKAADLTLKMQKLQARLYTEEESADKPDDLQKVALLTKQFEKLPEVLSLYDQAAEKLGLNEEQKRQYRKGRADVQQKMAELTQEMQKLHEQLITAAKAAEKAGLGQADKDKPKGRDELQRDMAELAQQLEKLYYQVGKNALDLLTAEQLNELTKIHRQGAARP